MRSSSQIMVMGSRVPLALAVTMWCSGAAFGETQPQAPANLVANGGFEQGGAGWRFVSTGANATGQLDAAEKHEGKYSYKLTNRSGYAPNLYARIVQEVAGLRPYTTYKVSCWAKGKRCGTDWIGGGPGWTTRKPFPQGDFDWQQVTFEVTTDAAPDNYELMVLTESQTEALWVDDIRFEPVKVDQAKQAAVDGEIATQAENLRRRVEDLQNRARGHAELADNPYVRLGIAVAQRFIDFAQKGGPDGRTSLAWSRLELEEVAAVLDDTERLMAGNAAFLNWQPPKPGAVRLKQGTFYEGGRPRYFAGYGHFSAVINDLPNFPALGASLIQDGRAGPSSMNADGTLGEGALQVLQGLDRAARFGMREDFLLSPHYYPAWAGAPDLANGNIGFLGFNIFHPKAKATIQKWIELMAERIKDKPALHSVCLANEPVYISSGRDSYTKPAFTEYLKRKHQQIAELNTLYGTSYRAFAEVSVPPPGMPAGAGAAGVLRLDRLQQEDVRRLARVARLDPQGPRRKGANPHEDHGLPDPRPRQARAWRGPGIDVPGHRPRRLRRLRLHDGATPTTGAGTSSSTTCSTPSAGRRLQQREPCHPGRRAALPHPDEPHPFRLVAGRAAPPGLDDDLGLGNRGGLEPRRQHLLPAGERLRRGSGDARSRPPGPGSDRAQHGQAPRGAALLPAVASSGRRQYRERSARSTPS